MAGSLGVWFVNQMSFLKCVIFTDVVVVVCFAKSKNK